MRGPAQRKQLDVILGNVRVPVSLVANPQSFGGKRERDCLVGHLVIRGGRVMGLTDGDADVDLGNRLVMPPFVEPHCHLDKCFTIERLDFSGGSLIEAIAAQAKDKRNWTHRDVRARATRALEEMWRAGVRLARTHVDWDIDPRDPTRIPLAWQAIGELCEEWRDRMTVQRAALVPVGAMADVCYANGLARTIASAGGVLGAFVLDQPNRRDGILNMVRVAMKHELALDFHVDESLAPHLDGFELIAQEVIASAFAGPVLCGHVCNLGSLEAGLRQRRIDCAARAGLSVVSLPSSNLYLQDREGGTPRLRGLTTVKELIGAGANVAFGTDNVQDAFCPIGIHNPAAALSSGILAAQLEPPVGTWLPLITTNAASALGHRLPHVDHSTVESLIAWDTSDVSSLVSGGAHKWRSLATMIP
ncbi:MULTISPECIES: amidohydrolase family protein [unclassified Chelatococcus]|uniref:amidohydrolase family protein n=1 Tax=unclassified Chelatococcus TaxID=2638111 RepID=UPI001BCCABDE|nr:MULTISPECIES: amidohydrolase family protein [unclassified Chelatococcus]MBS7700685.1 amidohydrolase family protein [Chelatococcus sp. YT9]MBX3559116.1 amidohydrolase family protein [Chelatococcus sp.]